MVSSDFRVTQQMTQRRVMWNLSQNRGSLAELQDKISSGKEIRRPSDSPVGVIESLRLRSDVRRNDQITRNIDDAEAWLGIADRALTDAVDQITRVRDLALQAKNASLDQNSKNALALEIDSIRQSLINVANTQYLDRPVFGGTTSGGVAYDGSGSYVGTSAAIERSVAPGVRLQVNVNGDEVFGPAGNDLFTTLSQLSADIRSGAPSTAIDASINAVDARTRGIQDSLSTVGARARRIEMMKDANSASGITIKKQLGAVEDIDLAKTITEMNIQETTYQAALAVTARVIQPSLLDFLR